MTVDSYAYCPAARAVSGVLFLTLIENAGFRQNAGARQEARR
ncbi:MULTISPECIES: hypothetical protein [Burkholderia cepacia complex]|uniref:Uncharacterized protein n=1 Tax=Burkholderia pyrrocinia TaxID=60550 RepID=A0ABZ3BNT5_BURPY|nr:hypothetical protein [Burkholderia stabilis]